MTRRPGRGTPFKQSAMRPRRWERDLCTADGSGSVQKKAQVHELEVKIGEVVIWGISNTAAYSKVAGTINITRSTLSCDALIRSAVQKDWRSWQDLPLIYDKNHLGMKLVRVSQCKHPDHKYLCESVMCWLHVAEIHAYGQSFIDLSQNNPKKFRELI